MTSAEDIDQYINKQKSPQKEICLMLRKLILKAVPKIHDEIRMGVPWFDSRFYIVAFMDHVNLGVSVNGLTKKEMDQFDGKGKLMRHLKFFTLDDIDEDNLVKLIILVKAKSKCVCE